MIFKKYTSSIIDNLIRTLFVLFVGLMLGYMGNHTADACAKVIRFCEGNISYFFMVGFAFVSYSAVVLIMELVACFIVDDFRERFNDPYIVTKVIAAVLMVVVGAVLIVYSVLYMSDFIFL